MKQYNAHRKKTASLIKSAGKTRDPQREGRSAAPDNFPTEKAKQSNLFVRIFKHLAIRGQEPSGTSGDAFA